MTNAFDFAQKVALVAGGTGGLGSAISTELRSRGCIVATVSRTPSTDPNHILADLRSPDSATAVVDEVVAKHGAPAVMAGAAPEACPPVSSQVKEAMLPEINARREDLLIT